MNIVNPVAVLWDIASFHVPKGVKEEDIAVNVRTFLRVHGSIHGPICVFSAYGDMSSLTSKMQKGCQNTGVNLIDIPNGNKGESHKAILVDMCLFALDHPPPCNIVLLSSDIDFAPALHKLGQLGYALNLITPNISPQSSALYNACAFVWTWSFVLKGDCVIDNIDQKALTYHHSPKSVCDSLKQHEADPICKPNEKKMKNVSKGEQLVNKEDSLAQMQGGYQHTHIKGEYQHKQNLILLPKAQTSSIADTENIMNGIHSRGKSIEKKLHHNKTRSPLKNLTNVLHCQFTDSENVKSNSLTKEHYVDPLGVKKMNVKNEARVNDQLIEETAVCRDHLVNQSRSGHKQKSRSWVTCKYILAVEKRRKKRRDNWGTNDPSQVLCGHKHEQACDGMGTHLHLQKRKRNAEGLIPLHESKAKVYVISRCSTAVLFCTVLCKKKKLIACQEVSDGVRRAGKSSVSNKKSLSSHVAVESKVNSYSSLNNGKEFASKTFQSIGSPHRKPTSADITRAQAMIAEAEYSNAKIETSHCCPSSSDSIKVNQDHQMESSHLATAISVKDVGSRTVYAPIPVSKNVPKFADGGFVSKKMSPENMLSMPVVAGENVSQLEPAGKLSALDNSIASVTLEKADAMPSDSISIRKGTFMTVSPKLKAVPSVQGKSSNIKACRIQLEEIMCNYKHVAITRETSKIPGQALCGRKRKRGCFKVKKTSQQEE